MAISRKTVLSRLIDTAAQPAYALDEKQRLVYCNEALAQQFGTTPDELKGNVCQRVSTPPATDNRQSMLNSLSPGPEVYLGSEARSLVVVSVDGQLAEVEARFVPFTEAGKVTLVLAVLRMGPAEQVPKPSYHDQIRRIRARLERQYDIDQLIGVSPAIQKVHKQAKLASAASENLLLTGPKGSGRERLAQAIHYAGTGEAPIVSLACHFLDDELLRTTVMSLVRQPNPGGKLPTLLLTDANELVEEAQHELRRQIAEASFRVIVTATVDEEGHLGLLPDLVDSVSTFTIDVPGLAKRPQDVLLLAEHCLNNSNSQTQKQIAGFEPAAIELLMAHSWPGNVAELQEAIESACKVAEGPRIQADELPRYLRHAADAALNPPQEDDVIDMDQVLSKLETELVMRALRQANSNKAQAARLLGIQRNRLLRRMEQLDITKW